MNILFIVDSVKIDQQSQSYVVKLQVFAQLT